MTAFPGPEHRFRRPDRNVEQGGGLRPVCPLLQRREQQQFVEETPGLLVVHEVVGEQTDRLAPQALPPPPFQQGRQPAEQRFAPGEARAAPPAHEVEVRVDAPGLGKPFPGGDALQARQGRVDTHLDLMRWRGGPRFTGREPLLGRLTALLESRRRQGLWGEPIGLLTHHLVHDEEAWRFLDELLLFPPLQKGSSWPEGTELFDLPVRPADPVFRARKGGRS